MNNPHVLYLLTGRDDEEDTDLYVSKIAAAGGAVLIVILMTVIIAPCCRS